MHRFKQNLFEFLDEYPEISHQNIIKEFGEPKDVVISYINSCDENYLVTIIAEDTITKASKTKTLNYYSNGKVTWPVSIKETFTYDGSFTIHQYQHMSGQ